MSGQKLIKMDALKGMFDALAFKNVITYIQSGNVVFDTKATDNDKLRAKIEKQLIKELGYEVITIVRSIEEITAVIQQNPFNNIAADDVRKLYVTFLSAIPAKEKLPLLQAVLLDNEEIKVIGQQVYMITPGYGNTKLSNTFTEKKLGLSATTRNWATVNKMTQL